MKTKNNKTLFYVVIVLGIFAVLGMIDGITKGLIMNYLSDFFKMSEESILSWITLILIVAFSLYNKKIKPKK